MLGSCLASRLWDFRKGCYEVPNEPSRRENDYLAIDEYACSASVVVSERLSAFRSTARLQELGVFLGGNDCVIMIHPLRESGLFATGFDVCLSKIIRRN